LTEHSPANHQLGAWVIAIPALGGLTVGVPQLAALGSCVLAGLASVARHVHEEEWKRERWFAGDASAE
jgi:hypothetical protein